MEIMDTKMPKARKDHQCYLCAGKIKVGVKYHNQTVKDGGMFNTFKTHARCIFLVSHFSMDEWDEGLSDNQFQDIIRDIYYPDKHGDKSPSEIAKILFDGVWDMRDYDELLAAGNVAQIEKLEENGHKPGFETITIKEAFRRMADKFVELDEEVFKKDPDYISIRREAADIANFAHMIILKCDKEIS